MLESGRGMGNNDHLFISYATEDYELAEWLTLKLTASGYRVWCDRIKLLGGESYPKDIDRALKDRTFRVLALLSRNSIRKPNPTKERTLALSLGKERGIDFLIPLNVDGLSATELDWMTADLTYVPFNGDWAGGFGRLAKKLRSIDAPRDRTDGQEAVCDWFSLAASAAERPEDIWTNLLSVRTLPDRVLQYTGNGGWATVRPANWPVFRTADAAWTLEPIPETELQPHVEVSSIERRELELPDGLSIDYVVRDLIRRQLRHYCLKRGLALSARGDLYFPSGLVPRDHLAFTGYRGNNTRVRVVGERTFRRAGNREKSRYHLSLAVRTLLLDSDNFAVRIQPRVHLTDLYGHELEVMTALRRRKAICKSWWNHEWLLRVLAIAHWLGGGTDDFRISSGPFGDTLLSGLPIQLTASKGIDEAALAEVSESTDDDVIDEDDEEALADNLEEDERDG
jgi:hypothetical protein